MASMIRPPAGGADCPDPSDLLNIELVQDRDVAVVTAHGEIDLYTAPLLDSALREAIDGDAELVVVDLSDVTFMASSGLTALLSALDRARQQRCELRLAGGGRAVQRPLQAAGLEDHFEHFSSASEARSQRRRADRYENQVG